MHSEIWGRFAWYMIHTISLHFMNDATESYIMFYNSLRNILPCGVCSDHYRSMINIKGLRPDQNANKNAIHPWTVNMHNQVNARLNKPQFTLSQSIQKHQKFDHNLAYVFIDLMIQLALKKATNDRLDGIRQMIHSLSYIYPCNECRNRLHEFNQVKNILSIPNKDIANVLYQWRALLQPHINIKWANSTVADLFKRENNIQNYMNQFTYRNKAIQRKPTIVHHMIHRPINRTFIRPIIKPINRNISRPVFRNQHFFNKRINVQPIKQQILMRMLINKYMKNRQFVFQKKK
jgi:cytidine deaminase